MMMGSLELYSVGFAPPIMPSWLTALEPAVGAAAAFTFIVAVTVGMILLAIWSALPLDVVVVAI